MADKKAPVFSSAEVFQQAMQQHQQGSFPQAETLYRQILQHEPNHPDALHFLGVMAYQLGNFPAAIELIHQALLVNPSTAMYSNLALVFQAQGNIEQLINTYQQALALENNPLIHYSLANVLAQQGNLAAAAAHYQAAIALNPDDAELHNSLGNTFVGLGNFQAAIECYRRVILLKPDYGQAHNNLANLLKAQGNLNEAITSYQQALTCMPDYARGYHNLAIALYGQGKLADAIDNYQKSIALEPYHESHYNLGCIFQEQGNLDEAKASFQQAIALKADFPQASHNLAVVLQKQGKLEAAIEGYEKTIVLNPDVPEVYSDLASALQEQGRYQAAIARFRQGLTYDLQQASVNFNLGLALLGSGNYEEGWQHAEYRYDASIKDSQFIRPTLPFPQWQGEPIAGKSILIWHEQGFGDEIQFCRYVSVLKKRGADSITLVCKKPLKPLFETLDGIDNVLIVDEISNAQPHDYWTFLLSIPLYCQTALHNIPATVPYLYVNKERINAIASRLSHIKEFKVGICWKGNPQFKYDALRSPGIMPFKPLFNLSGVRFFALQPGTRAELMNAAGSSAVDMGHEIDAATFEDSAALIMNLDLVVTSCTSICHLAGALGKPVWVVLPFIADWRWLIDREDSPWYPNTRLFRQTQRGQWQDVIEQVGERLKSVIEGDCQIIWAVSDKTSDVSQAIRAAESTHYTFQSKLALAAKPCTFKDAFPFAAVKAVFSANKSVVASSQWSAIAHYQYAECSDSNLCVYPSPSLRYFVKRK